MAKRAPLEDRFWAKADRTGGLFACWIWTGGYNTPAKRPWLGTRRPIFKVRNAPPQVVVYAARLALSLTDGVALEDRTQLEACHTCDNPRCVNPAHLYWGTPVENRADRYPARAEAIRRGLGSL